MTEEIAVQQGVIQYIAKNNDGIKLAETGDAWWNYGGVQKAEMQAKVAKLNAGDLVKLVLVQGQPNKYGEVLVVEANTNPTPTPAPKARSEGGDSHFMDDYRGIEELLDQAHEMTIGDLTTNTELLHYDFEKREAVCRCTVQGVIGFFGAPDGPKTLRKRTCNGLGDASPDSIGTKNIEPHFIRMAETRALVRALRWYTNNGATAAEEIPGLEQGPKPKEDDVEYIKESQEGDGRAVNRGEQP